MKHLRTSQPTRPPHFLRRAFTLVEVLVVISIFVLLLSIAVPAFSSMLYSSEQSLVENSVRVAMANARDYAARSPAGQDSAAVFLYDSESKKTSILICTLAGTLQDVAPPPSGGGPVPINALVLRDVFAAAPGVEATQLTVGWTIRGYAPGGMIDSEWYETTYATYENQGNWLFPETSFYDDTLAGTGNDRQSFMIRFEGGTGLVKMSSPNSALVHFPSTSLGLRQSFPPSPGGISPNPLNPDNEPDSLRYVRRILAWPIAGPAPLYTLAQKQVALGDQSPDTILCKAIGQIAVCSERRLARGISVEPDRDSGCIYRNLTQPTFVANVDIDTLNEWIEGRLTDGNGGVVDSDCRIFTIQRYLGWLQEVTGTKDGLGVGS